MGEPVRAFTANYLAGSPWIGWRQPSPQLGESWGDSEPSDAHLLSGWHWARVRITPLPWMLQAQDGTVRLVPEEWFHARPLMEVFKWRRYHLLDGDSAQRAEQKLVQRWGRGATTRLPPWQPSSPAVVASGAMWPGDLDNEEGMSMATMVVSKHGILIGGPESAMDLWTIVLGEFRWPFLKHLPKPYFVEALQQLGDAHRDHILNRHDLATRFLKQQRQAGRVEVTEKQVQSRRDHEARQVYDE